MRIDYETEIRKLRTSDAGYKRKLDRIVERDNRYQETLQARGGTMTSSLTEQGNKAAQSVIRERDAARATLSRPVVKAGIEARAQLVAKTLASARVFLADYAATRAAEYNLNHFLTLAGQAPVEAIADSDANAAAFIERAERVMNPTKRVPQAHLPPVAQPDFSDLVV